jgi:hypothetical protein
VLSGNVEVLRFLIQMQQTAHSAELHAHRQHTRCMHTAILTCCQRSPLLANRSLAAHNGCPLLANCTALPVCSAVWQCGGAALPDPALNMAGCSRRHTLLCGMPTSSTAGACTLRCRPAAFVCLSLLKVHNDCPRDIQLYRFASMQWCLAMLRCCASSFSAQRG